MNTYTINDITIMAEGKGKDTPQGQAKENAFGQISDVSGIKKGLFSFKYERQLLDYADQHHLRFDENGNIIETS